ncbi:HMG box domain-containing protein [Mycena chlorophos]|uniref:HMG box domain-containing protein n=1 Tax=Mycena chlorophos TaxID=658473 RepID=A0A8H6VTE1_MYCCL|nr:HMG box domain-containing protein [Mycena chlorophos]
MKSTVLYPIAASSASASASHATSVGGASPIEIAIDAAIPPPSTKKHAAGHIPRPRNAFILFRSDNARKQQLSSALTNVGWEKQKDLSRSVGRLWRAMSYAERAEWYAMAEEEKERHAAQYPGYKYTPRARKLATPGPATILPPTMPSRMAPAAGSTVLTGPIRTPIYYWHWIAPSVRIEPYTRSQVRSSLSSLDDTDSDSDEDSEMIAPALSKACWSTEEENDDECYPTTNECSESLSCTILPSTQHATRERRTTPTCRLYSTNAFRTCVDVNFFANQLRRATTGCMLYRVEVSVRARHKTHHPKPHRPRGLQSPPAPDPSRAERDAAPTGYYNEQAQGHPPSAVAPRILLQKPVSAVDVNNGQTRRAQILPAPAHIRNEAGIQEVIAPSPSSPLDNPSPRSSGTTANTTYLGTRRQVARQTWFRPGSASTSTAAPTTNGLIEETRRSVPSSPVASAYSTPIRLYLDEISVMHRRQQGHGKLTWARRATTRPTAVGSVLKQGARAIPNTYAPRTDRKRACTSGKTTTSEDLKETKVVKRWKEKKNHDHLPTFRRPRSDCYALGFDAAVFVALHTLWLGAFLSVFRSTNCVEQRPAHPPRLDLALHDLKLRIAAVFLLRESCRHGPGQRPALVLASWLASTCQQTPLGLVLYRDELASWTPTLLSVLPDQCPCWITAGPSSALHSTRFSGS